MSWLHPCLLFLLIRYSKPKHTPPPPIQRQLCTNAVLHKYTHKHTHTHTHSIAILWSTKDSIVWCVYIHFEPCQPDSAAKLSCLCSFTLLYLQVSIPGLHISLGIFYRLFDLLEEAVNKFDFQVAIYPPPRPHTPLSASL